MNNLLICNEQILSFTTSLPGNGSYRDWCCYIVFQYFSSFLSIAQDALEHLLTFGAMLHFSLCHTKPFPLLPGNTTLPLIKSLGASGMGPSLVPCQPWEFFSILGSSLEAEGYQDLVGSQKHSEGSHSPLIFPAWFFLRVLILLPSPLFFSLTCNISLFPKKKYPVILEVMIWFLMSLLMYNHPAGWRETTCKWAVFI